MLKNMKNKYYKKKKQINKKYIYKDKKGNLNIKIKQGKYINIKKIIKKKKKFPIKLCFPQIIKNKINKIYTLFNKYIKKYKYNGKYTLVYPIKVNQESYIIKYILEKNKHPIGLESGSKSELMNIIINSKKKINILCNGYKDNQYIHIASLAANIGHKIYLIIEKINEINIIKDYIHNKNIKIGIRIKLNSLEINQKKNNSQIKFGLTSSQIIELINILKKLKIKNKLCLLHCHIGSQINDIKYIKNSYKEFINIYKDIYKIFKINIKYLDFGGGLSVNYNNKIINPNYNIKKYISLIVKLTNKICKKYNIITPNIITESGRYITSHHSILITNIINIENNKINKIKNIFKNKKKYSKELFKIWKKWNKIKNKKKINKKKLNYLIKKIKLKFKKGKYNIIEKSWIEKINLNLLILIKKYKIFKNKNLFKNITLFTSHKIHVNFSLFQSIPDAWGIKQIFPIYIIGKYQNIKKNNIHISDITCDADGTINKYINKNKINNVLKISKYKISKSQKISFFMIGSYQNILRNIHNLFGNVETYTIFLLKNKKIKIKKINKYDNILNMLKYTNVKKKKIQKFIHKNKIFKKILKYNTYLR